MGAVPQAHKREETGSYGEKQDPDRGVFQPHRRHKTCSGDAGRHAVTKSTVSGFDKKKIEKTETQLYREGPAACRSACLWRTASVLG